MGNKKYAIIVAGGNGTRMGSDMPKQFIPIGGKPILMHTIEAFYNYDRDIEIILVLPKSQIEFWQNLCTEGGFNVPHQVAAGGETRYHSVSNGLKLIKEEGLVAVHDGVRPFASAEMIDKSFDEAAKSGAAIPVVPVKDSIRLIEGNKSQSLERSKYYHVQTPQCFSSKILIQSYNQPYQNVFTDDASVVEASGFSISLIDGEMNNIKITTPFDLRIAEVIINEGN